MKKIKYLKDVLSLSQLVDVQNLCKTYTNGLTQESTNITIKKIGKMTSVPHDTTSDYLFVACYNGLLFTVSVNNLAYPQYCVTYQRL